MCRRQGDEEITLISSLFMSVFLQVFGYLSTFMLDLS